MVTPRRTIPMALGLVALSAVVALAQPTPKLLVHAGAGIRPALDEAGAAFEKATGVQIDYNYKGSACLLPDVLMSGQGDVYIPGELYYVKQAVSRKLVDPSYKVVATMSTVVIVQPGNPKRISTLQDLAKPGIRLGLGDPKAVAIGRAAKEALTKAKVWEGAQRNLVMSAQNVSELGNAIELGHLDAAVVWDATAAMCGARKVTTIAIPAKYRSVSPVPAGVVSTSKHHREAQQYVRFLASAEGRRIFLRHGFGPPPASGAPKARGRAKG